MPNNLESIPGIIDPRIKRTVKQMCAELNVQPPQEWYTLVPCCDNPKCTNRSTIGVAVTCGVLGFAAGIGASDLPDSYLRGAIAHELGHVYYQDMELLGSHPSKSQMHESEFRADRFAMQHGYADDLLAMFRDLTIKVPHLLTQDSDEHPPMAERIRRLEVFLASRTDLGIAA